ncbi:phosphotransferase [Streptomyces sp. NBC_01224]|uniref:phosphotransferase n=1 Tax=Streptomyces sp. NBC_01224 TaxID=2903783 RepID=UPI003FA37DC4
MRPDLQAGFGVVAGLLPLAYAIVPREVRQGPAGTDTRNYMVGGTEDRRWFVKVYRPGTDVATEHRALEASEFAALAGVPVARVQRTLSGGLIASQGGQAPPCFCSRPARPRRARPSGRSARASPRRTSSPGCRPSAPG